MARLKQAGWGWVATWASITAVPLVTIGCEGNVLSAGVESTTLNLENCYGERTSCRETVVTTQLVETGIHPCDTAVTAALEESFVTSDKLEGRSADHLAVGPDGSIWVLSGALETISGNETQKPIVLLHYAEDGTFLASSPELYSPDPMHHTQVSTDLTLDAAGDALVAIYTSYAANADSAGTERMNLRVFEATPKEQGNPEGLVEKEQITLNGTGGGPYVVGGQSGQFFLVANAPNNAARGSLTELKDLNPFWIQNQVRTSGAGAGVGISGLSLSPDLSSTVLSQRSPRWQPGSPETWKWGLSRYSSAVGNLKYDVQLPSNYAGGYRAAIASLPNGDVVVAGLVNGSDLLVRNVDEEGRLDWAYQIPGAWDAHVAVDALSGASYVALNNGVAMVTMDGKRCERFTYPEGATGPEVLSAFDIAVAAPYLYISTDWDIRRYRLPALE